ncbi:MAG TPA: serine hydrolase domain-containing protein [Aliidongia sp.]|uniref:serine hydrolase domain-containing protein n=1 Tax=Aliidongia sp. TaxID=1914230 RepID=UPI002DDCD447|nr:serine hydrolase domain-containing protein [Aliidongia sp.]HEV2676690.1 serine hydrolase domain-containing protein [Aliidongia sp.]
MTTETLGFSTERLQRITAGFEAGVAAGRIGGAVAAVMRRGETAYFEATGYRDKAAGDAMAKDAIFRIYSMTKPLTSVAAMILVERGQLLLGDAISKYLPSFANQQVAVVPEGGGPLVLERARRPATIQDLLRHTSGLVYDMLFETTPVKRLYREAEISTARESLTDKVDRLGRLPLAHQPGEVFEYGYSTDVLGRVIEIVAGQPLDAFIAAEVTGPLGMVDSGFWVPPAQIHRLAEPVADAAGKIPPLRKVTEPPLMLSGGGGMVGTTADYLRFCTMLLNGGALDGVRILGAKTVAYMTTDHLGTKRRDNSTGRHLLGAGHGFGLGFSIRLADGESDMPGSAGDYSWGGYAGTQFWVDPKEQLIAVMMIQQPNEFTDYWRLFRNLVYQAIVA